MPRKPATEAQRQDVRRRLQRAAAAIYREDGLSGLSARKVADRAGVSVGSIYSYFDNLPALMQSLWMEPVERFTADLETLAAQTPDPLARLNALLKAYVAFALANPDLYRGAFLFVRPETLPKPKQDAFEDAPFAGLLVAAIEEAQLAGQVRPGSAIEFAQILWAGLHGAIALPMNIDRIAFDDRETLAYGMADTLLNAFGVNETAATSEKV